MKPVSPETHECVLKLPCGATSLANVLSLPPQQQAPKTAVLIIVGGPQYRVGSHRQFVLLARHLASQGFACLRFDVRGMGDTPGTCAQFESLDEDIGAAISGLLDQCRTVTQIVLWGLCDGASAALLYVKRSKDTRVSGLCLVNPWLRSEQSLARTHVRHYYFRRLRERAFWQKLLSGGIAGKALNDLATNVRKAIQRRASPQESVNVDFRQQMARGWMEFRGPVLLVTSGDDYTAREFLDGLHTATVWRGALQRPAVQHVELSSADHTFSDSVCRRAMETQVSDWLIKSFAGETSTTFGA